MSAMADLLASAAVPAFKCPPGTKVFLLNLGILRGDEGWYVAVHAFFSHHYLAFFRPKTKASPLID